MHLLRRLALTVVLLLVAGGCNSIQVQQWWQASGHGHISTARGAQQVATNLNAWAARNAASVTPHNWAPLPAIRACESGGNYHAVNPSGTYRGAYQFDQGTWNGVASRHASRLIGTDPAAASIDDQDWMAWWLYTERGTQPWPICGRL